jgi:hypothetical protein
MKKEIKLTTYFGPEDTSSKRDLSGASPKHHQLAVHQQGGD